MIWIWMGQNPKGKGWSLGMVGLFSLEEALAHYARRLRRAGFAGARA